MDSFRRVFFFVFFVDAQWNHVPVSSSYAEFLSSQGGPSFHWATLGIVLALNKDLIGELHCVRLPPLVFMFFTTNLPDKSLSVWLLVLGWEKVVVILTWWLKVSSSQILLIPKRFMIRFPSLSGITASFTSPSGEKLAVFAANLFK